MIGEIIDGKYEIVKLIGEGGMGAVYEATNLDDSARCAVKVINDEAVAQDDVLIARFKREAQAAKKVRSDHIVEMLDAGHDDMTGHPYMVMEMLDGENALELLKRIGPLPPQLALRIGVQTCLGLAKAHGAKVVHRDIKPANLFLAHGEGDEVTVKLLDFGVAKFKMDQASESDNESLTRTGSMLGSPMYMSPEQARGLKSIDHRADIWSLGVVMYQLLSGRVPLQDVDGLGELIISICSEPPPPVSKHAPWVSKKIDEVIAKALSLSTEERYQTAEELGKALEDCLDDKTSAGKKITKALLVPLDEETRKGKGADDVVVVKTGDGSRADDATVAMGPEKAAAKAEASAKKPPARTKPGLGATGPASKPKPPKPARPAKPPRPLGAAAAEELEPEADDSADADGDEEVEGAEGSPSADEAEPKKEAADEAEPKKEAADEAEPKKGTEAEPKEAAAEEGDKDDGPVADEVSVLDDWIATKKEEEERAEQERAKEAEAALEEPVELPTSQPSRKLLAVVAGAVVAGVLLIGYTFLSGGETQTQAQPSATTPVAASSPAAPSAAPSATATATVTASAAVEEPPDAGAEDAAAAAGEGARVQIVPKHAEVTVDGEKVPVVDGYVVIQGEPGSEHVVILKVWGATRMARVRLTPDGPKPDRVIFVAPRKVDIYE